MEKEKIKNLVICSTLNQITNYLIIEKYTPDRIFNITFEDGIMFNINIKPKDWDIWLAQEIIREDKFPDNIELSNDEMYSLIDIKKSIEKNITNKISKNDEIYWHVTGGQRTIALAISELIKEKERKKDRLIYIEGNTEKLIINNCYGELLKCDDYGCNELTFGKALRLVGFDTKNLKSTTTFKEKGKKVLKDGDKEGYKFYKKLYNIMCLDRNEDIEAFNSLKIKEKLELNGLDFIDKSNDKEYYKDTFRNLLLKSNTVCDKEKISSEKKTEKRREFVRVLFKKLLEEYPELDDVGYYNSNLEEIDKSYPAGYIFEKLTAYKIYDLIKNNPKIIGMETSLKTYFKKDTFNTNKSTKDNIIDELDIVLLTNTGKIINFECKSGGMKGDNAKSHNFTTYRLSGVFGMPILLSPLYSEERKKEFDDEILDNQLQALRAAEVAELEVFTLDEISCGMKKLGIVG